MLDRLAAVVAPALLVTFGAPAAAPASWAPASALPVSVLPVSVSASARAAVGGVGAEGSARQGRQVAVRAGTKIKERARIKVYTVAVDCANGGCGVRTDDGLPPKRLAKRLTKRQGERQGEQRGPGMRARVVAGVGLLLALGAGVALYVEHRRRGSGSR
ncbi:hypothetical protein ACQEU3_13170 [Spirillospora sp. CA-253888]